MAKDPICGMTVDEATALRAERDGHTFYFCSEHCRQKFLEQAEPNPPSSTTAPGGHSCCGTAANPAEVASDNHRAHAHHHDGDAVKPKTTAKYFCPMCPGAETDEPGDCPKW